MGDPAIREFSLVRGGPMYRLQGRLGLLGDDGLPTARTGLVLAAVAWVPPAILAVFDERTWSLRYGASYFTDFGAYARYLIAVVFLTVTDRVSERRVSRLLSSFVSSGIVAKGSYPELNRILDAADRRTESWRAEAVMLVLAYGLAAGSVFRTVTLNPESWMSAGGAMISPAGIWNLAVSIPLFFFVVLRWFWRFAVWTMLLRGTARLSLRLVPTHPDRAGGLGFLTLFPIIFVPLTFCLSVVIAAAELQGVVFGDLSFESLRTLALVWVAVVLVVFVGPLTTFTGKLLALREAAIVAHGELVARHMRRAEEALREMDRTERILETETISGMADISPGMLAVHGIKLIPVELWSVIPLLIAAVAPMLPVAALEMPLSEIAKRIASALL
jgi:hypothetical protein